MAPTTFRAQMEASSTVVLGIRGVDDEVRRDEADKMARRCALLCPGAAARGDRRCSGGGDLRVDHALLDLAAEKFNQGVTEMSKCK